MNNIIKIKKLIKKECANYNYDGYMCWPRDCVCKYFVEHEEDKLMRCGYFEKAVLPVDPNLESEYRKHFEMGVTTDVKVCEGCGTLMRKSSNRQKYCNNCKKYVSKEQKRQWASENREK